MDHLMPGMNGTEAASTIRGWEESMGLRPVPIVAVTAGAMESEQWRYAAAGMSAVLLKPFSASQLRDLLARFLVPRESVQQSAGSDVSR